MTGRLTGRGFGTDLVELGHDTVTVPSRWIGLPVRAYVVRSGSGILFLSGDVVDGQLTPVDETAPSPAVGEVAVRGDDNVGSARLQLALTVVSTALAVWAFVSVVQQDEPSGGVAAFTLLWAATSAVMVLASSIGLVSARREARSVYAVRGGADGTPMLEVDRAGRERRHAVAALRRIESEIDDDPGKRSWTLHFESGPSQRLCGCAGARIVQEIRRLRPEVPVMEYRPTGGDSSGGP